MQTDAVRPPAAREQLWRELHDLFEWADDGRGYLPEFRFLDCTPDGAGRIFDELVRRAEPWDMTQPVWHEDLGRAVPLSELRNPGRLAALGQINLAQAMDIYSQGYRIPTLGVFVRKDELFIDYEVGFGWNAETVAAFVELLDELHRLEPDAQLAGAPEGTDLYPDDVQERLQRAIATYLAQ
jgi:hypothetical protein